MYQHSIIHMYSHSITCMECDALNRAHANAERVHQMPETEKWDAILTLGAAIAEETHLRVARFKEPAADELYVLASAMAWTVLRRYWDGEQDEVLRRWHDDIPDAINRYSQRTGIKRP